ncbi:MAG: Hsp70 family protein [Desulfobacteraceae bacterium]|jgi:molecular chaperone DnaK|nr:Hsp70 family protein [Desulfobacteraceae bacterium]
MEPIIGIDLGTTNSEVAFIFDGVVDVISENDKGIVPSCVGLNQAGNVIVGLEAFNQALAAPEKTILSVKRLMGTAQQIKLGDSVFSPQEISAFILKALKERAEKKLKKPVSKAVITVPAYFTDAQRQATREAGEIAGLQVIRIINEPTAASLAYESSNPETRRILVFDLGGGTFDVSIVKIEKGVVEVLSSTGDNHLGGDDFDWKIVERLAQEIQAEHDMDVRKDVTIMARLKRSAEKAKIELSAAPFSVIEEDHIAKKDGRDIHLSFELSRIEFEAMIETDLSRTMESVTKAMKDAAVLPSAIEKIILVGGSTRIPMVSDMLEKKIGHLPHSEIDPDLCVAVGAGMQAAREMGMKGSGVLIDVTPYTFGTSAVGEINGQPTETKFIPLIRRNTKLPARKSEVFETMYDNQKAVNVQVCQGEAPDALDNILLGNYLFNLTDAPAGSPIVLNFDLDLNGILKIKAIEKTSGKEINAVIENAMSRFSDQDLVDTQNRINGIWSGKDNETIDGDFEIIDSADQLPSKYEELINRAMAKISEAPEDDRDEMINIIEDIRDAATGKRWEDADASCAELDDILFYIG